MQKSGFACPTCDAEGKTTHLLYSPGGMKYQCELGHVLQVVDTMQLMGMNLRKIQVTPTLVKANPLNEDFSVSLPKPLIEALKSRFKESLTPTIQGVLTAILDEDAFFVSGFDAEKLRQPNFLGQKVRGADKMLGMIYALKNERDDLTRQVENGGSNGNGSVPELQGDFVQLSLRIPLDSFVAIRDRAKANNKQPNLYMMDVISSAISNGWI